MTHLSDEEILEGFANEDSRRYSFNLLVRKYQERVYWQIRRLVLDHDDADDITQQTFIKIWEKLDSFRGKSKLHTWIYRIAHNQSLDFLRKKTRFLFIPIGDMTSELENRLTSDAYFDGDEIEEAFQKALAKLPEKQRATFLLRYYDELKFDEIAEVLNLSTGGVKANYHLARKKLEQYLRED